MLTVIFTPLRGRSHPQRVKGKQTHTDRHRHPSMHTDIHTCKHTARHAWEKCVISTLPARQQPALAEPGTSNLCSRSREEMLTGPKREEAFRYGPICLGLSFSVCQSVGLESRSSRTHRRRHPQCQQCSVPRAAHASAMSIMRCLPAGNDGIANAWSKPYASLHNASAPVVRADFMHFICLTLTWDFLIPLDFTDNIKLIFFNVKLICLLYVFKSFSRSCC